MAVTPSLGLNWIVAVDPTVGAGVSAPYGQVLFRTDDPGLYWKSGQAPTAWTRIGVGSAVTGFHNSGYFGDGGDGDKVVVGNEVLTRDMAYNTLTIPVGTTLQTAGFRVFVRGLCIINGRLHNDGNPGLANGTAGTTSGPSGSMGQGKAGGAGGGTSGAGSGTSTTSAPRNWVNGSSAAGGAAGAINQPGTAGNPGTGTGQAGAGGGSGGTTSGAGPAAGANGGGITLVTGSAGDLRSIPQVFTGRQATGSAAFDAGSGGGGGGRGATTADRGGGGGAGGGVLGLYAYQLSGTGFVSCRGGAGGTPTAVSAGGGGAGGGGQIISIYAIPVSTLPTFQVTAGTPGVGGPADATRFAGGAGGAATAGNIIQYNISST